MPDAYEIANTPDETELENEDATSFDVDDIFGPVIKAEWAIVDDQLTPAVLQTYDVPAERKVQDDVWASLLVRFKEYLRTKNPNVRDELAKDLCSAWVKLCSRMAFKRLPAHMRSKGLAEAYTGDGAWSLIAKELSLHHTDKLEEVGVTASADVFAIAGPDAATDVDVDATKNDTSDAAWPVIVKELGRLHVNHANLASLATDKDKDKDKDKDADEDEVLNAEKNSAQPSAKIFIDVANRDELKAMTVEGFKARAYLAVKRRLEDYARKERWNGEPRPNESKAKEPVAVAADGKQEPQLCADSMTTLDAYAELAGDIHNTDVIRELSGTLLPDAADLEAEIDDAIKTEIMWTVIRNDLPAAYSKVIKQHLHYPHMSREQSAAELGLTPNDYKSRLCDGKEKLIAKIKKGYPDLVNHAPDSTLSQSQIQIVLQDFNNPPSADNPNAHDDNAARLGLHRTKQYRPRLEAARKLLESLAKARNRSAKRKHHNLTE